jgi:uncharacterized membrane protein YfcA
MFLDIAIMDFALLGIALLVAGSLTGVLAGVFGVGGGVLIVPVLYELFRFLSVPDDIIMPLCIGTSLAIIIPTSVRSYLGHRAKGAVDGSILKVWAVPVVLGVVLGGLVARFVPQEVFKLVFIAVATTSAIRLLFARDGWIISSTLPGKLIMRVYGVIIGLLSALMGIGGGQLSSLFMMFYGRPIHQAVATSSGLGVLISIPGAISYILSGWPRAAEFPEIAILQPPFALGFVSLIGALFFVPASILTAPLGVTLAHKLSKRRLEVAFGIFLILVAGRFVISML